jgi:hypothetical protein
MILLVPATDGPRAMKSRKERGKKRKIDPGQIVDGYAGWL